MIAQFSLLSSAELETLPRELTCIWIPVGGLEGHGPHLPVGTKLLKAEELARKTAERLAQELPQWKFLILPSIPLSVDTVTTKVSLSVRPHVVRDAIVDQCEQLKRMGFVNFAVVSGQTTPQQLMAIEDAAKIVGGKSWISKVFGKRPAVVVSVSSFGLSQREAFESPMIQIPEEHGGQIETGLVLDLNPQWVGQQHRQLPAIDRPKASMGRFFQYFSKQVDGYWGHPSQASPEVYQKFMHQKIESWVAPLKTVLETGKGLGQFRSPYRWFPINGSFFKAYLLATVFFLVMMLWVLLSLKGSFEP